MLILDGSRISGEIPPMVTAPSMRIRKHAKLVQPLDYFVGTGTMTAAQLDLIRAALVAKRNIVIVGSTASGKTFLANSILHELAVVCPTDRVLTIEDTAELRLSSVDSLAWVTSPEVDMQLMLKRALRATPGPYRDRRGARRRGVPAPEDVEHGPLGRAVHDPQRQGARSTG